MLQQLLIEYCPPYKQDDVFYKDSGIHPLLNGAKIEYPWWTLVSNIIVDNALQRA